MIKKIVFYSIGFTMLFAISYAIHLSSLKDLNLILSVPLFSVYLFHFIISLLICIGFAVLSESSKWDQQLGFVYMFTFITKLMLFAILFKNTVFKAGGLSKIEAFNLLIPVFLFLFLEVYFIAKILSKK
ncbi:DUF6168 family protein [Oceanihabitans sp. 2_MG-2023]|uniref:DUF6168 family protein n=1 Tax=Oceanihabitans sp. 2_MG-2023 TaxID=3062661 RepID=UPI0026E1B84E|nr:DUF6168 family protein [Oceanihabitans sp. 2_MG-2023]MDO6595914.1 DUF6168 family protein [Oceanihabitans sp. 2_MG-2023]